MKSIPVGTAVVLIGTDGSTPPLGSVGVVVEAEDSMGDHLVEFGIPCPIPPESGWYAHKSWLVPLFPDEEGEALVGSAEIVNHAV